MILDTGAYINAKGGRYSNTLQAAAARESSEIVQILLDTSANINAKGGNYSNTLQAAAF